MGSGSCRRDLAACVLPVLLIFAVPTPAWSAVFPFALLLQHGAEFTTLVPGAWVAGTSAIYPIVNGEALTGGPSLGKGSIFVWGRTTADPYSATFGPIAGLGVLEFYSATAYPLVVHLGLIQTPDGAFKTTIGAFGLPGPVVDTTVRGSWVIGDGASVIGGTSNDLIIAGLWIADTPQVEGIHSIALSNLFGSPGEADPTTTHCFASCAIRVGSFFGQAKEVAGPPLPVRGDSAYLQGGGAFTHAHLLVIQVDADNYAVVACSDPQNLEGGTPLPKNCTLSGTGPATSALSGSVNYNKPPGSLVTILTVGAYLVSPGNP
jgi:hypothetical protein